MGCRAGSVANYMRLLRLPGEVQGYLADGRLGFSEARVLLQLTDTPSIPYIAKEAIDGKMSVAQLIERVDRANLPQERFRRRRFTRSRIPMCGRYRRRWSGCWVAGCGSATARDEGGL